MILSSLPSIPTDCVLASLRQAARNELLNHSCNAFASFDQCQWADRPTRWLKTGVFMSRMLIAAAPPAVRNQVRKTRTATGHAAGVNGTTHCNNAVRMKTCTR